MALFVYITAPDMPCAEQIATLVVEKRLAACANILPGMHSIYWWEGAVQHSEEVVIIAKTEEDRYPDLEAAVLAAHPYDCPCIVAFPITCANPAFHDWIHASTRVE